MEAIKEVSQGMGAIVMEKGVTFRVWAPNADSVYITGSFNNWKENQFPLEHEENGYWAVIIKKAKEFDEYKFVIHNGNQTLLKNDPYALELSNSNGNSIIRNVDFEANADSFRIEDWNKLVIYELHIGTFNRKNENSVGTFKDVIEKISYLKELGVNAIELLPINEFSGGVSWGYNPAHPFAIEKDYGGIDGFIELIKALHKNGIAVIIDVVYNHFGPSDLDLWQFDGWSENDKGGIYFYNDHRSDTPWGDTRPDYGRTEVRQYIRDNALFWIEKYHCDGLRMDATSYVRFEGGGLGLDPAIEEGNDLLREINTEIHSKYPHILTIAEDLKGDHNVTKEDFLGGIGYSTQWDMNFVHPIREVLTQISDEHRSMQSIVDALLYTYNNDVFQRVVYTESHDEVANGNARLPEEIEPGGADSVFAKKRALIGIVLTLTAPGIPMLFQGQEFAEDEYFQDSVPLDWSQHEKHKGIKNCVADLIKFRKGFNSKTNGLTGQYIHILHFNDSDKVLAYSRSMSQDHSNPTIIVINFSATNFKEYTIGFPYIEEPEILLNSNWRGYDSDFSKINVDHLHIYNESFDNQNCRATLNRPAYSAILIA